MLHIQEKNIKKGNRVNVHIDRESDESQADEPDKDPNYESNEPTKRIRTSDTVSSFFMTNKILSDVINLALNCGCGKPGNFQLVIGQYKGYNCNIKLQCQCGRRVTKINVNNIMCYEN